MFARLLNRQQSRRGFSLVELMIVVGIIGILATMARGRFQAMTIKAKRSEANMNLKHLHTLYELYVNDHGDAAIPNNEILTINPGTNCNEGNYCNTPNVFNFRITNCPGRYYAYSYIYQSTPTKFFQGTAAEINGAAGSEDDCKVGRSVFTQCSFPLYDRWTVDGEGIIARMGTDPATQCN